MRQIIRVNMSTEPSPRNLPRMARYGGRALTSAIVFKEVPADADPLGPTTSSSLLRSSGGQLRERCRLSSGEEPLTGASGIKRRRQAANALGRLGVAAVVVEGKPADSSAGNARSGADGSASSSARRVGRHEELRARRCD